ncbi:MULTISPECIES: hypothetical protein [unclassified Streptosporangium]|uniref:hypothetical protein n=1 Tax=unclassified Streptosporangium TaxID=2632669 RepID=UPI002E29DE7A|nr:MULTISPECIES: hypothetical protein [unclassified Streptosporangium]
MVITVIGVILLGSGCMLSPSTLRVPAAALDSVRGIGKVEAEISIENERNNSIQIENLLVIDVKASSDREALDKAVNFLSDRNWRITGENRPVIVSLESTDWQNTNLTLRPFNPMYFEDHPNVLETLKKASIKEESLVYLEVFEGEI